MEDIQLLLRGLFKDTIDKMLELELEEHLGYNKNSFKGNSGNSRNGYNTKIIQTKMEK